VRVVIEEAAVILSLSVMLAAFSWMLSFSTGLQSSQALSAYVSTNSVRLVRAIYDAAAAASYGGASLALSFQDPASEIYACVGTGWLAEPAGYQPCTVLPPSFSYSLPTQTTLRAYVYSDGGGSLTFSRAPSSLKLDGVSVAPAGTISVLAGVHYVEASFAPGQLAVSASSGLRFFLAVEAVYSTEKSVAFHFPSSSGAYFKVQPYAGYLTHLAVTVQKTGGTVTVQLAPSTP